MSEDRARRRLLKAAEHIQNRKKYKITEIKKGDLKERDWKNSDSARRSRTWGKRAEKSEKENERVRQADLDAQLKAVLPQAINEAMSIPFSKAATDWFERFGLNPLNPLDWRVLIEHFAKALSPGRGFPKPDMRYYRRVLMVFLDEVKPEWRIKPNLIEPTCDARIFKEWDRTHGCVFQRQSIESIRKLLAKIAHAD
jgi:hypothetical protein